MRNPTTPRPGVSMLAVLALAALWSGCSGNVTAGEPSPVAWAQGDTIHLEDGTRLEVDDDVTWFAPSGDGVLFTLVPDDEVDWHTQQGTGTLWHIDRDGDVSEIATDVDRPRASPDGRYVVWGVEGESGDPLPAVLLDTETGERLEPRESEPDASVRRLTDDALYFWPTGTSIRDNSRVYDLETGRLTAFASTDEIADDRTTSPDGQWQVVNNCCQDNERVVRPVDAGSRIRLDLPFPEGTWQPQSWVDDDTLLGTVSRTPEEDVPPMGNAAGLLVACSVPSGECEEVPAPSGEPVLYPGSGALGVGVQGVEEVEE